MNSKAWKERAERVIPGGVHSPVRAFNHVGGDPIWFEKGDGPYLIDVEGNRYVDFCMSFGPHILGHCPPAVVESVRNQAEKAMSFGACHPTEVELAEWILKGYSFLDRVRLVNSGTEAVMTAVRLARGYTGRNKIIQFEGCYHGHSDGLLAKAGSGVAALSESSSKGVPPSVVADTLGAQFKDLETLKACFDKYPGEVAAVLIEPVPANNGLEVPSKEHLVAIMEMARANGSLVIFDEVITGFRLSLSGACGYFGLEPDLVTLGKIVGGGLPLAALAGKAEIMDSLAPLGEVYQAGTLSGNPLATAAGCAVLKTLFDNPPYAELEFLTTSFVEGLKSSIEKTMPVNIRHVASLFWMELGEVDGKFPPSISQESREKYGRIFHHALKNGVYFAPSPFEVGFLSTVHQSEILTSVIDKMGGC